MVDTVLKVANIIIVEENGNTFAARCYSGGLTDGAKIPESEMSRHILITACEHVSCTYPDPSVPAEWQLLLGGEEWISSDLPYLESILAERMFEARQKQERQNRERNGLLIVMSAWITFSMWVFFELAPIVTR